MPNPNSIALLLAEGRSNVLRSCHSARPITTRSLFFSIPASPRTAAYSRATRQTWTDFQKRNMSTQARHRRSKKSSKRPVGPRPSASVLLISPTNQILLLHRVSKASSFPSAHVFPGGALSEIHDGLIPHVNHSARHDDGPAYRMAAIRETFEECGILLATSKETGKFFTDISNEERERGRRAVHSGKIRFKDLLGKWGAVPDTKALIPFTRWITPSNVPKRFTTQMYLYFLPLGSETPAKEATPKDTPPLPGQLEEDEDEIVIPKPTHDGGIEHTPALFLPPKKWIDLAQDNRIILYPPQFFLIFLLAPYLALNITSPSSPTPSLSELERERETCLVSLRNSRWYEGEPQVSFMRACISPVVLGKGEYGQSDQVGVGGVDKNTAVLALDWSGKEVEKLGLKRRGIKEWVITARFTGDGPRDMEVRRREDVLGGKAMAKL